MRGRVSRAFLPKVSAELPAVVRKAGRKKAGTMWNSAGRPAVVGKPGGRRLEQLLLRRRSRNFLRAPAAAALPATGADHAACSVQNDTQGAVVSARRGKARPAHKREQTAAPHTPGAVADAQCRRRRAGGIPPAAYYARTLTRPTVSAGSKDYLQAARPPWPPSGAPTPAVAPEPSMQ